jgi:hypothetical protein
MKGYKVFKSDFTCKGFQYEVGKTFHHKGEVIPCESGFHFCLKPVDCFHYYLFDSNNIVCEVEASDVIIEDGRKHVTNTLTIVRQLSWYEVLDLLNTGNANTGYDNSGDDNSGKHNSGDCNTGNNNSGDYNTGNNNSGDYNTGSYNLGHDNTGNKNLGTYNSGYYNAGNHNAGDYNTGDYNTGNYNAGDYNSGNQNTGKNNSGSYNTGNNNSGYFNSTNYSSGVFNTQQPKAYFFNKPSDITTEEWTHSKAYHILSKLTILRTDTKGKICNTNHTEIWTELWENLTDKEKSIIQEIPNFDEDIFFEITGIKLP